MSSPEIKKEYYSLPYLAGKWHLEVNDLLHCAEINTLEICIYIDEAKYDVGKTWDETEKEYFPGGPCPIWLSRREWRNIQRWGHPEGSIVIKHPQKKAYLFPVERDYAISEYVVTHKEKLRFEAANGLANNTKATTHSKPPHKININEPHEVDEFVRSLRIYPENDDTINIQIPGKKAKPFTGLSLGFHKTSKTAVEWGFLQEIIREGRYCIRFSKTKDGEANSSCRRTVNKKMIDFLSKEFDAQIPPNYKLFEKSIEDKKGTWKPKFKIRPAGKDSSLTKDQILVKIKAEYSKDNPNQETINELVVAAKEKGISNDELKSIIPWKYKEEEVYEPGKGMHTT